MRIIAKTDVGKVRSSNQDSYAAGEFQNGVAWAVVCDGMGGNAGGNIASSTAVKSISDKITLVYRDGMTSSSIKYLLITAITNANYEVFDMASSNSELKGMGTTVVAAIITPDAVYVSHVGDSRAYLVSKNEIRQITKDHSVVQDMVEKGEITPDEAKSHPRKNLITRALGVDEEVKADFLAEDTTSDDVLLICTDGLSNFVDQSDIYRVVCDRPYTDFADTLVDMANEKGGADNITVVAVAY